MSTTLRKRYESGESRHMTFGVLPPFASFAKRFAKEVPGGLYNMQLVGDDEVIAQDILGEARMVDEYAHHPRLRGAFRKSAYALNARQTYDFLKALIERGGEAEESLASSIMGTLEYEWI